MTETVFVNDLPYNDGEENPLESLTSTLAFSVDDWGSSRAMAWVWGIVCGWDAEGEDGTEAMDEVAASFGWSADTVERLRRLRRAFVALAASDIGGDVE